MSREVRQSFLLLDLLVVDGLDLARVPKPSRAEGRMAAQIRPSIGQNGSRIRLPLGSGNGQEAGGSDSANHDGTLERNRGEKRR